MKGPDELKYVNYETKNGVAWITLNDPKRMNPLSLLRVNDIREALRFGEDDDDAVILCLAAQGPNFGAGAEVKPYRWGNGLQFFNSHRDQHYRMWDQLFNSKKPVVAAIHGYTLGFAWETVLRCDIIIATENTMVGIPEIQLASNYGNQKMARLAGEKIQMWYSLTGDLMTAQKAEQHGLINLVVPNDNLEEAIYEFCDKVKRWSPTAVWLNRLAIKYGLNTDIRTGEFIEDALETLMSFTPDWAKGGTAFQAEPAKRQPRFTKRYLGAYPSQRSAPTTQSPF